MPIALGTALFGSTIRSDDAFRIMDRYHELGGDHLDTAHVYAAWLPEGVGASERTVGAWVRQRGLAGSVRIASKGAHFVLATPAQARVRPECIAADLRESLDRLGLPRIDLYYLHRDDPSVPVDALLDALERERRAGLIGAYAASNWSTERMEQARLAAAAHGWAGFAANQVQWSLAEVAPAGACGPGTRSAEPALRAWHRTHGVPLAAYSPQAQGFFARDWDAADDAMRRRYAAYLAPANLARWRRVAGLARQRGIGGNRLALAWLLAQPQPVWPVVGSRSVAQVEDSMLAARVALTAAEAEFLDQG